MNGGFRDSSQSFQAIPRIVSDQIMVAFFPLISSTSVVRHSAIPRQPVEVNHDHLCPRLFRVIQRRSYVVSIPSLYAGLDLPAGKLALLTPPD
jgi:hypothetical protein